MHISRDPVGRKRFRYFWHPKVYSLYPGRTSSFLYIFYPFEKIPTAPEWRFGLKERASKILVQLSLYLLAGDAIVCGKSCVNTFVVHWLPDFKFWKCAAGEKFYQAKSMNTVGMEREMRRIGASRLQVNNLDTTIRSTKADQFFWLLVCGPASEGATTGTVGHLLTRLLSINKTVEKIIQEV